MRLITLAIASALLITTAGAVLADPERPFGEAITQMQPIVLGTVTATTAHTVSVTATDGEAMTFEYDSRTVKPADLVDETPVRVEFKMLDTGTHLAQRITPLTRGSHDWDVVMEKHAVRVGADASEMMANNQDMDESAAGRAEDMREQAREDENRNGANVSGEDEINTTASNEDEHMPRTASELPWVLSLGVVLLVASAGLWLWRRRDTT